MLLLNGTLKIEARKLAPIFRCLTVLAPDMASHHAMRY